MIWFSAPCIQENIGNKQCEPAQNHAACEYDGGDCCLHWVRYANSNTKKYKYNKDKNAFLDYIVLHCTVFEWYNWQLCQKKNMIVNCIIQKLKKKHTFLKKDTNWAK